MFQKLLPTILLMLASVLSPINAAEGDANLEREMTVADFKTRAAALSDHEMALLKQLREGELNHALTDDKRDDLKKMIDLIKQDREELIKKAQQFAQQQPDRNDPNWQDRIRKALEQKVTFEFADVQLNDAIAFFRQIAGVNVIVDPALNARNTNLSLRSRICLCTTLWIGSANWSMRAGKLSITPCSSHQIPPILTLVVIQQN